LGVFFTRGHGLYFISDIDAQQQIFTTQYYSDRGYALYSMFSYTD